MLTMEMLLVNSRYVVSRYDPTKLEEKSNSGSRASHSYPNLFRAERGPNLFSSSFVFPSQGRSRDEPAPCQSPRQYAALLR